MRIKYFDSARALASYLGIVYHVALVFTASWIVSAKTIGEYKSLIFFVDYLSVYRMPLFLFISGYLTLHSIKNKSTVEFFKNRMIRLGVPLIFSLIFLVSFQNVFRLLYNDNLSLDNFLIYFVGDKFSLSHLWFLYNIIIYSFFVLLIYKYWNKKIINVNIFKKYPMIIYMIIIFIMFYFIQLFGIFLYKVFNFDNPLFHSISIFSYLVYFLLGNFYYISKEYIDEKILKYSKIRLLTVVSILVILNVLNKYISFNFANLLINLSIRITSLLFVLICLKKWFNRENKVLSYMSKSSYSIYLLHQPLIVFTVYVYDKINLWSNSIADYYKILLISTLLIYLCDYLILNKTKYVKFLMTGQFSGKRNKKNNKILLENNNSKCS